MVKKTVNDTANNMVYGVFLYNKGASMISLKKALGTKIPYKEIRSAVISLYNQGKIKRVGDIYTMDNEPDANGVFKIRKYGDFVLV